MDKHDTMQHEEHENHEHHENQMKHSEHKKNAQHNGHDMQAMRMQHEGHDMGSMSHEGHDAHSEHTGHGTDHTGHEMMFRTRFWWSLLLSLPVLIYSELIQRFLGFTPPTFPGSEWIPFFFSLVIFAYGGVPFLQMAVPEIRSRKPGMMTLISLAISVALVSLTLFLMELR